MSSMFARSAVLLALVLAAVSARAADPGTYVPPKRPAPAASPAPAPAKPARTVSEQARVLRQKDAFMLAADLCARKDTCDQDLLRSTEKKFVEACQACAPTVDCENEREAILAGKASRKLNPCAQAAAAAAAEKPGPKEKSSGAAAAMAARKAAAEKRSQGKAAAQAKKKPGQ